MKNYIKKIRTKIGQDMFIHPAARIIVENAAKEILVIERTDNGKIGIPAGALEEDETIEECIKREVEEETGLHLLEVVVIGISSNPKTECVQYPNGDKIQYFTIEFYSNSWEGAIKINDKDEIRSAKFVDRKWAEKLPQNEQSAFDSLKYYEEHQKIRVK